MSTKALTREEGLFVSAIHAAQIDEPLPRATWALYLLCAVVAVAVAWSALAKVDEITRSDGRIVMDGPRDQVLAALSGVRPAQPSAEGVHMHPAAQPVQRSASV